MQKNGRKTSKARRALYLRLSTDPQEAREQRKIIEQARVVSGYRHMNDYLFNLVYGDAQRRTANLSADDLRQLKRAGLA